MADSHLNVLLPTLRRCSRLRFLRLCGNPLSMAALKDLLQKTLKLPDLHLVVYPFPMDCYKPEQDPDGFTRSPWMGSCWQRRPWRFPSCWRILGELT
ncbi:LRC14 protein, partial [Sylvietta virens]|nr:LRC14 protein [Sylvietta virens]